MATNPRNANGHRRRELRKRKLAAGGYCTWPGCPWPTEHLGLALVNQLKAEHGATAHHHPHYPEVDEIHHTSRGGDPLSHENTRLLHRWCNEQRSNKPDSAARTPAPRITASPGWGPSQ